VNTAVPNTNWYRFSSARANRANKVPWGSVFKRSAALRASEGNVLKSYRVLTMKATISGRNNSASSSAVFSLA
jgi:hypothetical protein